MNIFALSTIVESAMNVFDTIRIVVYRVHEKGLEVLMLDPTDAEEWSLPEVSLTELFLQEFQDKIIKLDETDENGNPIHGIAIEGDWHDIPSLRGLLQKDIKRVKRKVEKVIPQIEKGTYLAVKEAFKKALPHEYNMLKELKDIITTRSMIKNI